MVESGTSAASAGSAAALRLRARAPALRPRAWAPAWAGSWKLQKPEAPARPRRGVLLVPGFRPEADQVTGRHAIAGRLHAVVLVLRAGEQLFVVVGRVIKTTVFGVFEVLDHRVGEGPGLVEPALFAGDVVQAEQAVYEVGVVVEVAVEPRFRLLTRRSAPGAEQSAVGRFEVFEHEIGRPARGRDGRLVAQRLAGSKQYAAVICLGAIIRGDTVSTARAKAIDAFDAGQLPVLLLQNHAGSLGLNLQLCRYAAIVELDWTDAITQQAIGRLYRAGQQRDVVVEFLLVAGSIDEHVAEAARRKPDHHARHAQRKRNIHIATSRVAQMRAARHKPRRRHRRLHQRRIRRHAASRSLARPRKIFSSSCARTCRLISGLPMKSASSRLPATVRARSESSPSRSSAWFCATARSRIALA